MTQNTYSFTSSDAFVEVFSLKPYKKGLLDGLTFAVKDNIDVGGYKTSFGSKPWSSEHKAPVYNAICVEQLLTVGATCLGKTIADEYTYSLDGESYFFGTPINPKAPNRVPGGSSSGSASAVACGLVDFSIGTDSAGSIRVPASLCGILGMRPTLHRISEAGVLPFMPSVSTVGAFSNDINVLENVMRTMLRSEDENSEDILNIYLLEDVFSTMAISSFAGIGGIPEISIPLATVNGAPVGLSVAAGRYQDEFLLSSVKKLFYENIE